MMTKTAMALVLAWWFLFTGGRCPINVGPFKNAAECNQVRGLYAQGSASTCWPDA